MKGGGYYLMNSTVQIVNNVFTSNYANLGAVIYSQTSTILLTDSVFTANKASSGASIFLESDSNLYATSLLFANNTASGSGGAVYLATGSYFQMSKCTFQMNTANDSSAIYVVKSADDRNITLDRCTFEDNTAYKNTLTFMYAQVLISSCYFQRNMAVRRSKNIFSMFSTIQVTSSLFQSVTYKNPLSVLANELSSGAYFNIGFDVTLVITDCKFYDALAQIGGAIFISGESNIMIRKSIFDNNHAIMRGGAIYANAFSTLIISDNTVFKDNIAHSSSSGDAIYVTNAEGEFHMEQSTVTCAKGSNAIYAENLKISLFKVSISDIYDSQSTYSSNGAALLCTDCSVLNIT